MLYEETEHQIEMNKKLDIRKFPSALKLIMF